MKKKKKKKVFKKNKVKKKKIEKSYNGRDNQILKKKERKNVS